MEQGKEEAALLSSQFFLCFSLSLQAVSPSLKSRKRMFDKLPPPSTPKRKKKHVLNSCCILASCNFIYICIIYVLCRQSKLENLRPTPPHTFKKKKQKQKLDLTTTHPLSRLIPCEMPRSNKRQPRRRRRRQKQLCHQKKEEPPH
jgi:hypothetical protein